MDHNLTLADVLSRFLLVYMTENWPENKLPVTQSDSFDPENVYLHWGRAGVCSLEFDSTQIVDTDGYFLTIRDVNGGDFTFTAYTIVDFDDELPPQS
jgi:hypothetical protein